MPFQFCFAIYCWILEIIYYLTRRVLSQNDPKKILNRNQIIARLSSYLSSNTDIFFRNGDIPRCADDMVLSCRTNIIRVALG